MATGGSLHRKLCEQPELLEHREDPELPVEQQYAPSHEVQVEEGDCCLRCYLNVATFG